MGIVYDSVRSIKGLSLKGMDESKRTIYLDSGITLLSWGENVKITFSDLGDNVVEIKVISEASVLVTWGRNRRHVTVLMDAILGGLKGQNVIRYT
jgi:hypothetical protein